jgi:methylmalonyl-CoA mutase
MPIRFVTAASLFDGHDASINIIRRLLMAQGVEVVHLGHNRSVEEIVVAAVQEDAQGIALSSYQGGHVEFFCYALERLKALGAGHIQVFGGGGGVIVPEEIDYLHQQGVARIYSPQDGQRLGLEGMIKDMIARTVAVQPPAPQTLPQRISWLENHPEDVVSITAKKAPVLGITGTGGAGKSSVTDELIRRFRYDQQERLKIAVLAVDPSRRKSGGALLGDRIRMNAIQHPNLYVRSLATREGGLEISRALPAAIAACQAEGFDLILVETAGIGQGDAAIVEHVDVTLYVMTPEFGAPSQLEKIDMLDFADAVAINKFDRRGAEDAWRDVAKQLQRNRLAFDQPLENQPVFGTIASRFNDEGMTALYFALADQLQSKGLKLLEHRLQRPSRNTSQPRLAILPPQRSRYLAEIADSIRAYHQHSQTQAKVLQNLQHLKAAVALSGVDLGISIQQQQTQLAAPSQALLDGWFAHASALQGEHFSYQVRGKTLTLPLKRTSLSGTSIPKVALPRFTDHGSLFDWLRRENLPGAFPYTAGVFPFKREGEDPARMFAGEGGPARTNQRFHFLSKNSAAKRLSTAFDSVTLYGADPALRPDIYGKIGTSGVSIATLDDMKVLYSGFDLCSPSTSVSMTINGPAPTLLAMFLNTAIDQQTQQFQEKHQREATAEEQADLRKHALQQVRGTVQADILKEDQGQNTCIFSTEFSLKCMADIQEYFIEHQVKNFYSVSISGYHIAEAGANPISQLAFTLSNGFTYVESYLARGMNIDDFAPNLSFFFSNGMDAEYAVLGRVARRIWAIAMRDKYGASSRSQMLKYHIQTSGRSLHAQEIDFNDIRTTLQALIALYDNCNSLHTNAYDEAITTPTEESVRRALAIQLIINQEWGVSMNENPNQGSFLLEELTDLVEEAVLKEFEKISERGGVLGAMETGYQRGKIQDESMHYEMKKHDGSLPIIGVNTYLNPNPPTATTVPLSRASTPEKDDQLSRLAAFQAQHQAACPLALQRLQQVCIEGGNVFAELMNAVQVASLGQITEALFAVGGQYRRSV